MCSLMVHMRLLISLKNGCFIVKVFFGMLALSSILQFEEFRTILEAF